MLLTSQNNDDITQQFFKVRATRKTNTGVRSNIIKLGMLSYRIFYVFVMFEFYNPVQLSAKHVSKC